MKILIGTDGSEFSRRALEAACDIAKGRPDVSFRIVSAYEPPVPAAAEPYALSGEYFEHLDRFAREAAAQNATKAVQFIKGTFPEESVKIDEFVELGRPTQLIVETADDWDADLVVVGSHGRGFWKRLALGSVSSAVVHHAPCSVLVVKSKGEETEE